MVLFMRSTCPLSKDDYFRQSMFDPILTADAIKICVKVYLSQRIRQRRIRIISAIF